MMKRERKKKERISLKKEKDENKLKKKGSIQCDFK
jgi:hypothetical protein